MRAALIFARRLRTRTSGELKKFKEESASTNNSEAGSCRRVRPIARQGYLLGGKAMSKPMTKTSDEDLQAYFDVWFLSPHVQRMLRTTSLREMMFAAFEAGTRGLNPR
jgi:hypothetical protein